MRLKMAPVPSGPNSVPTAYPSSLETFHAIPKVRSTDSSTMVQPNWSVFHP
jgi:hypothetical protein